MKTVFCFKIFILYSHNTYLITGFVAETYYYLVADISQSDFIYKYYNILVNFFLPFGPFNLAFGPHYFCETKWKS